MNAKPIDFERADPEQLAKFDPRTKACTMNCGPCSGDPRSAAERKFLCDDCEPAQPAEAARPAPSVPDGWRELCRRLYVELFHCDKQMTNTRDDDGEPVWRTGATVRAVLDDAKAALDAAPTPAEPPADLVQDSVASEPVGYLYTNLQSGEYHVSDYDDDYRGPERALWCIEPVYRRAKGQS